MPEDTVGIRNKNYLNVKNNPRNPWQGSDGNDERGHTRFRAPEWGLRAAIMTLRTYWFAYGLRTVSEILSRWAPASDTVGSLKNAPQNNPAEYSKFVCAMTGVGPLDNLQLFNADKSLNNVDNLKGLVVAMAAFENGHNFTFPEAEFYKALFLIEPDRAPEIPGGPPPPPSPPNALTAPGGPPPGGSLPAGAFEITHAVLSRLMTINAFPMPDDGDMIFFGIRGCVPVEPDVHEFQESCRVRVASLDYKHPRCTIGQWKPAEKLVAVFPGSTIPTAKYVIASAEEHHGNGTNQLLSGYYSFEKGIHHAGGPTAHEAFRQSGTRIYLRTADNAVYEPGKDRVDIGVPYDNLHAAFGEGLDGTYSSAGCQVVVGFPKCENHREEGPWSAFRKSAYGIKQNKFKYLLLDAVEVAGVSHDLELQRPLKLRCGSHERALQEKGLVTSIQKALKVTSDGDFGAGSALAAMKFQREEFGASLADGVVGPQTAEALKVTPWPSL